MRTIQKLEIGFGTATFVAALLCSYYFLVPDLELLAAHNNRPVEWTGLYVFILQTLIIAVSACVYATTKNGFGLFFLFFSAVPISFLYAVGFLIGYSYKGFLGSEASPGIFAAITVILAFYDQIRLEQLEDAFSDLNLSE